jgi:hypothetical protein
MRKTILAGLIVLLGITVVMAVSDSEKNEWTCKKDCTGNFTTTYTTCQQNYTEGKNTCKDAFKTCRNETKIIAETCKEKKDNRTEYKACLNDIKNKTKTCVQNHIACDKTYRENFLGCLREARTSRGECRDTCKTSHTAEKACEKMGGTWNTCASPCNGAENCVDVCVPKCEFKQCQTTDDCEKKQQCINNSCIESKENNGRN